MDAYDVVVIGSGTSGQTAAHDLREKGLRVAVAEKSDRPGGVCALSGCQPKKWFYEVTEAVAKSRHLKRKGMRILPEADWFSIREEKNSFTGKIPQATVNGFEKAGIDFLPGRAAFVGEDRLAVDARQIRADYYIIAAGAGPMPLPFEGSEHAITSDDFLDLDRLPERILFVGGGFISFEFSHFVARLGPENRRITILEVGDRPLGGFDAEMVDLLVAASEAEGIGVHTGIRIDSIRKGPQGFSVTTGSEAPFEADLVVHGAGRVANLDGLDLDRGQIQYSRRGIRVDDAMRTSNPRVFAVGDCAETMQLARVADFEAHIAARNILSGFNLAEPAKIDYGAVPAILFTYPQYAMVGKTEAALKQEGVAYRKSAGKNLAWPTYRRIGMAHAAYKLLAGTDNRILGAHILSDNASGMINTLRLAMLNRIPADELHRQSIMSPYPTRESDLIYMLEPFL